MKNRWQRFAVGGVITVFVAFCFLGLRPVSLLPERLVLAQTPTPEPAFDQSAALAKLREAIKGKENEPAEKVFKNIQTPQLRSMPAARVLAIMEFGYSRSLGVTCTHCHIAGQFDVEDKPQKQIARDMSALVAMLNGTSLRNIKNLKSASPTVNCTTCHRGEIKPALNLAPRS